MAMANPPLPQGFPSATVRHQGPSGHGLEEPVARRNTFASTCCVGVPIGPQWALALASGVGCLEDSTVLRQAGSRSVRDQSEVAVFLGLGRTWENHLHLSAGRTNCGRPTKIPCTGDTRNSWIFFVIFSKVYMVDLNDATRNHLFRLLKPLPVDFEQC